MLTDKIGRINISQFDVGVAEDFKEIYSDLKADGMETNGRKMDQRHLGPGYIQAYGQGFSKQLRHPDLL